MTVGQVCNRIVVFAYRDTPLPEAAKLMRENHIGSLVIVDEAAVGRVPVGILTDRDIAVAVVAQALDPRTLTAGEVMTGEPVTANEQDDVLDTLQRMRRRGVRRLPVVAANGTLAGIVTLDDLLELVAEQLGDIVQAITAEQSREARTRK
jgi:CBS domain-containing protein